MEFFSLKSKSRFDSFDSVDSSFDVVSIDESIEERIDVESVDDEEEAEDGDQVLVEQEQEDDQQDDGAWENLDADTDAVDDDDVDVEIELEEGFEDAIEAALEASIPGALGTQRTAPLVVKEAPSPRWRNARQALRDFYLARAKTSEESSKHYRTYTPPPFVAPVEIAPLRAPERYDVELYERVVREENERKAQLALRAFYAERDAAKAQRAAENRANERFVYDSQIGSSASLGAPGSCAKTLYWETTRFVRNGTEV